MFYNNRKHYSNSIIDRNRKIQEIYKDEMNNECFDCGKSDPDFISANNGVFLCKDCMSIHYRFSDDVSLIIKNNLFLLNEEQINYIYFGGNRKLLEFINYEFPQLQNYQPEILYKTLAMQYYRDKLYYLVEGGNKPVKPNEHFAYKLINNYADFPMTEKRKKFGINNQNVNHALKTEFDNYYFDEENEEILNEEDNINSNLYIYNYYNTHNNNYRDNRKLFDISSNYSNNSSFVYTKNKMNRNNSFIINKLGDRSLTNFPNKKIKIREPENINFLSNNNNSKSNFYQKRDNFFKEMNRLFGGKAFEDEENEYEKNKKINVNKKSHMINDLNNNSNQENNFYRINNNSNYATNNNLKAYEVRKSKANIKCNNYIKNNNNTNIYLDEVLELQKQNNLLSKSQLINNNTDNNFIFGHPIGTCNNINNSNNDSKQNNNDKKIRQKLKNKKRKKISMNIQKKIYIKPKIIITFNSNEARSPSITQIENNFNSLPVDEFSKTGTLNYNANSDTNEKNNLNDSRKKENIFYDTLSPTIFSPLSNKPQIFSKKNVNYLKRKKKSEENNSFEFGNKANKEDNELKKKINENNNNYLIDNENNTVKNKDKKINNKDDDNNKIREIEKDESDVKDIEIDQMNNCEQFDNFEINKNDININKNNIYKNNFYNENIKENVYINVENENKEDNNQKNKEKSKNRKEQENYGKEKNYEKEVSNRNEESNKNEGFSSNKDDENQEFKENKNENRGKDYENQVYNKYEDFHKNENNYFIKDINEMLYDNKNFEKQNTQDNKHDINNVKFDNLYKDNKEENDNINRKIINSQNRKDIDNINENINYEIEIIDDNEKSLENEIKDNNLEIIKENNNEIYFGKINEEENSNKSGKINNNKNKEEKPQVNKDNNGNKNVMEVNIQNVEKMKREKIYIEEDNNIDNEEVERQYEKEEKVEKGDKNSEKINKINEIKYINTEKENYNDNCNNEEEYIQNYYRENNFESYANGQILIGDGMTIEDREDKYGEEYEENGGVESEYIKEKEEVGDVEQKNQNNRFNINYFKNEGNNIDNKEKSLEEEGQREEENKQENKKDIKYYGDFYKNEKENYNSLSNKKNTNRYYKQNMHNQEFVNKQSEVLDQEGENILKNNEYILINPNEEIFDIKFESIELMKEVNQENEQQEKENYCKMLEGKINETENIRNKEMVSIRGEEDEKINKKKEGEERVKKEEDQLIIMEEEGRIKREEEERLKREEEERIKREKEEKRLKLEEEKERLKIEEKKERLKIEEERLKREEDERIKREEEERLKKKEEEKLKREEKIRDIENRKIEIKYNKIKEQKYKEWCYKKNLECILKKEIKKQIETIKEKETKKKLERKEEIMNSWFRAQAKKIEKEITKKRKLKKEEKEKQNKMKKEILEKKIKGKEAFQKWREEKDKDKQRKKQEEKLRKRKEEELKKKEYLKKRIKSFIIGPYTGAGDLRKALNNILETNLAKGDNQSFSGLFP